MGNGPFDSPHIDPLIGAPQADIFHEYKLALIKTTALDRATRAEERIAKREKRPINPDNIERLALWNKLLPCCIRADSGWYGR